MVALIGTMVSIYLQLKQAISSLTNADNCLQDIVFGEVDR